MPENPPYNGAHTIAILAQQFPTYKHIIIRWIIILQLETTEKIKVNDIIQSLPPKILQRSK